MQGIWKITRAIQTAEAKKDYALLSDIASERGRSDLIEKFSIQPDWGAKKIDKQAGQIRAELGLKIEDFWDIKRIRYGSA